MLGHRFAEGKNSLNAIRLVLAAMVIVSHSWWLGGYGPEPQPGGVKLGTWAVIGFFGISGYLITQSRVQARTTWSYARARFLRIYGPLWTLFWEIVCYVLVGVVFGFFRPETCPPRAVEPVRSRFRGCSGCRCGLGRLSHSLRLAIGTGFDVPGRLTGLPLSGPDSCQSCGSRCLHCRSGIRPVVGTRAFVHSAVGRVPAVAAFRGRVPVRHFVWRLHLRLARAAGPCFLRRPRRRATTDFRWSGIAHSGTSGLVVLPLCRGTSPALAPRQGRAAKGARTGMMKL